MGTPRAAASKSADVRCRSCCASQLVGLSCERAQLADPIALPSAVRLLMGPVPPSRLLKAIVPFSISAASCCIQEILPAADLGKPLGERTPKRKQFTPQQIKDAAKEVAEVLTCQQHHTVSGCDTVSYFKQLLVFTCVLTSKRRRSPNTQHTQTCIHAVVCCLCGLVLPHHSLSVLHTR